MQGCKEALSRDRGITIGTYKLQHKKVKKIFLCKQKKYSKISALDHILCHDFIILLSVHTQQSVRRQEFRIEASDLNS